MNNNFVMNKTINKLFTHDCPVIAEYLPGFFLSQSDFFVAQFIYENITVNYNPMIPDIINSFIIITTIHLLLITTDLCY